MNQQEPQFGALSSDPSVFDTPGAMTVPVKTAGASSLRRFQRLERQESIRNQNYAMGSGILGSTMPASVQALSNTSILGG